MPQDAGNMPVEHYLFFSSVPLTFLSFVQIRRCAAIAAAGHTAANPLDGRAYGYFNRECWQTCEEAVLPNP